MAPVDTRPALAHNRDGLNNRRSGGNETTNPKMNVAVPLGAAAGTFLVLLLVNVVVGFSVITITLMLGSPYIVYRLVRRLRAR